MAKSLIGQDIRDWSEPLKNKKREKFCQEYVRLEMVQKLPYEKRKRMEAYNVGFNYHGNNAEFLSRKLMRMDEIKLRIDYLLNTGEDPFENKNKWNENKSINFLLEIASDEDLRASDRLSAIKMLNEIKGIGEEEDKSDKLSEFLKRVRGK